MVYCIKTQYSCGGGDHSCLPLNCYIIKSDGRSSYICSGRLDLNHDFIKSFVCFHYKIITKFYPPTSKKKKKK